MPRIWRSERERVIVNMHTVLVRVWSEGESLGIPLLKDLYPLLIHWSSSGGMLRPDLPNSCTILHPDTLRKKQQKTFVFLTASGSSITGRFWRIVSEYIVPERVTAGEENVIISPLTDKTSTDTETVSHRSVSWFLSYFFLDRAHGHILKIFTQPESCDTDPWVLQGAQSRLRQLQTNVVTVNPECNLSAIKYTSSPPEITRTIFSFLRPKQKQNRKHDDRENTLTLEATWLQGTYTVYTAVLSKQYERCGIFGVYCFKKTEGTLGEAWESKSVNVRWEEWRRKMLEEQKK